MVVNKIMILLVFSTYGIKSHYFLNRFGQSGGFVKLRERFDDIMGFQKPDLTSSICLEEKISTEENVKEIEEENDKVNKIEGADSVSTIEESSDVSMHWNH